MNDKFKAWLEEKLPYINYGWPTHMKAAELALWVIEDPEQAGFSIEEITGQKGKEGFPDDRTIEEYYSFLCGEIKTYLESL